MRVLSTVIVIVTVLSSPFSAAFAASYGESKCEVRINRAGRSETTVELIDPKYKVDLAANPYQKGYYAYVYRAAGMVFNVRVAKLEERIGKAWGHENDTGEVILSGSITAGKISTNQSTGNAYASGNQVSLNLGSQTVAAALTCYSPGAPKD